MGRYRDFLSHSGPGNYFLIAGLVVLLASLVTAIVCWRLAGRVQALAFVPLLVFIVYAVWTQMYFVPINQYIGKLEYDAAVLKASVDGWVFWEKVRLLLVASGLAASIAIFERYRAQRASN